MGVPNPTGSPSSGREEVPVRRLVWHANRLWSSVECPPFLRARSINNSAYRPDHRLVSSRDWSSSRTRDRTELAATPAYSGLSPSPRRLPLVLADTLVADFGNGSASQRNRAPGSLCCPSAHAAGALPFLVQAPSDNPPTRRWFAVVHPWIRNDQPRRRLLRRTRRLAGLFLRRPAPNGHGTEIALVVCGTAK